MKQVLIIRACACTEALTITFQILPNTKSSKLKKQRILKNGMDGSEILTLQERR